mmetsp:Transcript_17440/g.26152  ORF Transcript_17440/g.26152 Transcript_17440/m.26152 type:complete len:296 (+) Transcript_17440:65-952(+)|eukprot:CAMPEP_0167756216 /NCGR_PEP_ID=MMETSP0110_2-20121227/9261_1 /TAXON_ID=629695 /ORGANISM="Gymnochlora sp., Strain CCMP2014" /LENGTH=295 /DNA_ID=CAMNT_0007642299 /DNA_START=19 /DNA_END=906 /DNA_ORIENTATION=-
MSETVGQMKTRHKLEIRQLEKQFKTKLKGTKGKDGKRTVKAEHKEMEKKMQERHKEELAKHEKNSEKKSVEVDNSGEDVKKEDAKVQDVTSNMSNLSTSPAPKKLSKAQRRRMRKQAKLEEQRKKAEEEAEKMTDYKAIESGRLSEKLKPQSLSIHEVPADGNCLFRACEHQISILDGKSNLSHSDLRERAATMLLENAQDYMPYLLTDSGSLMTEEEYKKYCDKMSSTSAWGGQAEIAALSRLLDRQIVVHSAFSSDVVMGRKSNTKPLHISYHQHYYSLGAHYNSVVSLPENK